MATVRRPVEVPVERVSAAAYTVPTETPESDGTLEWDSTTIVVVDVEAGGERGLGYSYTDVAAAELVERRLRATVEGSDAVNIPAAWDGMIATVRNVGRAGIAAAAISAVDVALWDLKARLLELPLVGLLGAARTSVPVYGSGGFTSYSRAELTEQLAAWVESGISRVKMKVGRAPSDDVRRVEAARGAIGPEADLFVDANGAYSRKQALAMAEQFASFGVSWFEEPVSSDDLEGLRLLRNRAPGGMEVAAGEYGYDAAYFRRMLAAGAVDVLQPDATRCLGITGFLQAAALCDAFAVPLSSHTAPALHLHVCCAAPRARHLEWFHDHVRIERLLFDGFIEPTRGQLQPDPTRPGIGLELRREEAARYTA